MEKLTIAHWAEDDQPREKLRDKGPQALSNAELLAILVGSGSAKEDAVTLMKRILSDCNNNLNTLGKLSLNDLEKYNGLGPAKSITILAACELGKRRQREEVEKKSIYNHMRPVMQDLDVEEFWALLMNQHYRLIKKVRISRGGITETPVDVRIIIKEAVLANCTILAVCHNHPSGNLCPSKADEILTRSLDRACEVMNIHFLDHVIVTDGEYYSFHEDGRC